MTAAGPGVRDGLPGTWDRIAGPGAGAAENAGSLGLGLAGAVLAPGLARRPARGAAVPVLRPLAADLRGALYGYLVAATALVTTVRDRRARRALGLVTTVGGVLLDRGLGPSAGAPWFAPVFFAKLLAGHAAGAALLPADPLSRQAGAAPAR